MGNVVEPVVRIASCPVLSIRRLDNLAGSLCCTLICQRCHILRMSPWRVQREIGWARSLSTGQIGVCLLVLERPSVMPIDFAPTGNLGLTARAHRKFSDSGQHMQLFHDRRRVRVVGWKVFALKKLTPRGYICAAHFRLAISSAPARLLLAGSCQEGC